MLAVLALSLVVEAAPAPPAPAGLYEPTPGRLVGITTFADGRTLFTDFASGWTGALTRTGEDRFVARRAGGDSIVARFLRRGPRGPDLIWSEPGRPTKRASRLVFRREQIAFSNGDVRLSGTLVLPRGRGPHPLVIRLHGAGPADRVNTVEDLFAHHGVAFFSYDKRGVHGAGGDWRTVGVETLATDALAAFEALARHPDIDPRRIGLGAGNEGGWVASVVADRVPSVAFVFLAAAPALSFYDEVLEEVEARLRHAGTSGADLTRAMDFTRYQMGLVGSGDILGDPGWKTLEAHADSLRDEPWFAAVAPWPRQDWRWEKFHHMAAFDPTPLWSRYQRPLLALYGGQDRSVPAAPNVAALQRAMRAANNPDATIEVLVSADHDGHDPSSRDGDLVRFAAGQLERPLQWVLERVRTR